MKPYSHTPISLFITRRLVHTRTEGAYTWCCTRSVAPTRVHAPHLQAQRHTQWDVGRGGLARAHTCTRRCARTHAAAAQPASHTSSGTQRPLSAHLHKQHFFPSSRTHTLCTRSCCPCPFSWCQKPAQGCPLHPVLVPLALPACGSPQQGGTFGFPLGAPQVCARFVPRSPWHNQVPCACVNTETTVTGTRCQVSHGGAGEGCACTGSVCACTSVVLCWGGVYVCRGMCSRAWCARCIDVHTRGVRAHTWAHTHTHTWGVQVCTHVCPALPLIGAAGGQGGWWVPAPQPAGVGRQRGLGYFLEISQHSFQSK